MNEARSMTIVAVCLAAAAFLPAGRVHAAGGESASDVATYAQVVAAARCAMDSRAWQQAAELRVERGGRAAAPSCSVPVEATIAFARGVGAAMRADPKIAEAELARLTRLRDAPAARQFEGWAERLAIQAEIVLGLLRCAEGMPDECLWRLRSAAEREESGAGHAAVPVPIVPARELLGLKTLEFGPPADALHEFESVLRRDPSRLPALSGAAQAALRAGDATAARQYAALAAALARPGDRPCDRAAAVDDSEREPRPLQSAGIR